MSSRSVLTWLSILTTLPSSWLVAADPIRIAEGSGKLAPKQPQAVVAEDGRIHLVYGADENVFYCRSEGSDSFSEPKAAFRVPNMSLGMRRGPRVAVSKKAIVVSAIGGKEGKGRDGDVLTWRSTDDGASWQGPARVNDAPDSAREGLHGMASAPDGSVWCVWLDLRAKRTELYASRSNDAGATWSKNVLVYRSPDGSVCECCHPSIAVRGNSVHVLFRNSVSGNRDMYLVSSTDAGAHFEEAQRLGAEHWKLNACPMDGGMLAVEPDGTVSTVWRRGSLVYATTQDGTQETLLGKGEQPWIATTAQGSLAVWTRSREGELVVSSLSEPKPRTLATIGRDPIIVSSSSGAGPVVAFWEIKKGDATSILATRVDGSN